MHLEKEEFINILKNISDKDNDMVGGSTSCICVLSSLSLLAMVISISNEDDANIFQSRIDILKQKFFQLENEDRENFKKLKQLFELKSLMNENEYKNKLQEKLYNCFLPCYEIAKFSYETMIICEKVAPKINKFLAGDILISSLYLNSSIKAAYINALANERLIKDKTKTETYIKDIRNFIKKGENIVYNINKVIYGFDNF